MLRDDILTFHNMSIYKHINAVFPDIAIFMLDEHVFM